MHSCPYITINSELSITKSSINNIIKNPKAPNN